MISFTILTTDAKELRDRLVARGILKAEPGVVPAREGTEIVEIPNPLWLTPPTETEPGVRDTRRVFMVKMVREAKADEENGEPTLDAKGDARPYLARTRLGKWVMANSVADNLGGIRSRRVGTKFWFANEIDGATLGVWQ